MNLDLEKITNELTPIITTWGVRIVGALVAMLVTLLVASKVQNAVRFSLQKAKLDETLVLFLSSVSRWVVLLMAGIGILGVFGVQTASFAAVLGATSLAIGLAFQGSLSNVASGVMLLVFRPFKVGDVVVINGMTAKVAEIGLMTLELDTPDNRRIIIPNASVFGGQIENITFHSIRRTDVTVGTGYTDDLDKVRKALQEAADGIEGQIGGEEATVYLANLGDSAIEWSVRIWVDSTDFLPARERLNEAIKKKLDGDGISIPFPQMDVHHDVIENAA
ncbi:MAG: mechanosensitive ion channel [Deltaproteobacteria bacterium]|nr:mechanosensitive ion channel [Deltaproteobacteria bacterium]